MTKTKPNISLIFAAGQYEYHAQFPKNSSGSDVVFEFTFVKCKSTFNLR